MPIPFGLILAQTVVFSVGDRSEVRLVAVPDRHFEAATGPTVAARSDWKHLTLSAGYGASLVLVPLESEPRAFTVFNNVFATGSYRWQTTTLTVGQTLGFGSLNFATQALSDPGTNQTANSGVVLPPGTGSAANAGGGAAAPAPIPIGTVVGPGGAPVNNSTPGAVVGGQNQLRAVNTVVHFRSLSTRVGVVRELTPVMRVGADVAYLRAGGTAEEDRKNYPPVQGYRLGALFAYRFSARDDVSSTASLQYSLTDVVLLTEPSPDSAKPKPLTSWVAFAGESWGHRFDARTTGTVGAGVSYTSTPLGNGVTANSIYPTVSLGINSVRFVSRGTLNLSAGAATAPALDPIAQAIDPRLSLGASAGFQKNDYFVGVAVASALSLAAQGSAGGLTSVGGSLGVGYRFTAGLSADAGVRTAYQSYQGTNVIPLTYGAFVGLTIGAATTLK